MTENGKGSSRRQGEDRKKIEANWPESMNKGKPVNKDKEKNNE